MDTLQVIERPQDDTGIERPSTAYGLEHWLRVITNRGETTLYRHEQQQKISCTVTTIRAKI